MNNKEFEGVWARFLASLLMIAAFYIAAVEIAGDMPLVTIFTVTALLYPLGSAFMLIGAVRERIKLS